MHRILIAAVAALLALPAAASAHVTIQPKEQPAGGFTVINVRVPNESDTESTTKVQLQMPDGFLSASYQQVPGWKVEVTKEKLAEPLEIEGTEVDEQVSEITISGGEIGPGEFQDFPLSVKMPEADAGTELTFKALQTYTDGEVVRWIGAPDSDKPAPVVTLTAADGGHGAAVSAEATAAPARPGPDGRGRQRPRRGGPDRRRPGPARRHRRPGRGAAHADGGGVMRGRIVGFTAAALFAALPAAAGAHGPPNITAGPTGQTTDTNALFTFAYDEPAPTQTFECSLDGADFAPCEDDSLPEGSQSYTGLAVGAHTFKVRRVTQIEPVDPLSDPTPAERTWTIVAPGEDPQPPPAPTLDADKPGPCNGTFQITDAQADYHHENTDVLGGVLPLRRRDADRQRPRQVAVADGQPRGGPRGLLAHAVDVGRRRRPLRAGERRQDGRWRAELRVRLGQRHDVHAPGRHGGQAVRGRQRRRAGRGPGRGRRRPCSHAQPPDRLHRRDAADRRDARLGRPGAGWRRRAGPGEHERGRRLRGGGVRSPGRGPLRRLRPAPPRRASSRSRSTRPR